MTKGFQPGAFQRGAFQMEPRGGGDSTYWRSRPRRQTQRRAQLPCLPKPAPDRTICLKTPPKPPAQRADLEALARELTALFDRLTR